MPFHVGYTKDFLDSNGHQQFEDIGRKNFEGKEGIHSFFLPRFESPLTPDLLGNLDAVVSLTPKYDATSFQKVERLLAIVRFGVGFDMVDVNACTEANILLCITQGAVDHSVAEAVMTWMLQLGHRSAAKDRLVREGRWKERDLYMGSELRGRTLGIVGFGGIGSKVAEFVRVFGLRNILVFDPYLSDDRARAGQVQKCELDRLLAESDYVSINCPLTKETRNLIGERELRLMKPSAYLINTARGGIVNEQGLCRVLEEKQIAGAAVDVFEQEPCDPSSPLTKLDNVLLAPHCIAWTHDLFSEMGASSSKAVLDLAAGRLPAGIVNREVVEKPGFQSKLSRFQASSPSN
jgi:phosphoglycerate dehydrogenase-like enzyme